MPDKSLKNLESTDRYLTLKDFSFELPDEQVAQAPLTERDSSRLLIWNDQKMTHSQVSQLCDAVTDGTLFIVNNSRVIASRLHGKLSTGGAIELLLLEPQATQTGTGETWLSLGKPMRKLSRGTIITFADNLEATVIREAPHSDSGPQPFEVRLSLTGNALLDWLERHGEMPLPPYISRKNPSAEIQAHDKVRYQTVYAEGAGSVAAPTAGLHFTDRVIASLKNKNCEFRHVTLHVGAGTFLPVKSENPADHVMHSERFMVPLDTLQAIERAKASGRKIVVVGTTALRSLEGLDAIAKSEGKDRLAFADKWLRTNIFIRPSKSADRHKPWCADAIMTNFHQPESTLFMLICALIGFDNAHKIYKEAADSSYRFYSYGDSSLLWL